MPGASYGTPGGSLEAGADLSWAAGAHAAEAGRLGEMEVGAALIDTIADTDGAVVLHDARIPIPGFTANIDHLVIAGKTILLIDAKRWSPGWYFSIGSRAYRGGFERCTFAERKTMPTAFRAIRSFTREFDATVITPLVVITSQASRRRMNTMFLRMPGAKVVSVAAMRRQVRALARKHGPADPGLIAKLRGLLNDTPDADEPASGPVPPVVQMPQTLNNPALSQELPRLTEES